MYKILKKICRHVLHIYYSHIYLPALLSRDQFFATFFQAAVVSALTFLHLQKKLLGVKQSWWGGGAKFFCHISTQFLFVKETVE
jgi:hypothetical protein